MISPTLKLIAYIMLGINLLAIIICGVWLCWQRDSPQVKVSQPFFLALVLLGCAISSSTIIAMAQEDDGDGPVPACMAIPWLYSVGFSITFGKIPCPLPAL
jgi:7 transmembrane sweet-taste receptor of 3 GCPR